MRSALYHWKRTVQNLLTTFFFRSPKVMLIDETIQHILDYKSSVSRFGDGELLVILGHSIGFKTLMKDFKKDFAKF